MAKYEEELDSFTKTVAEKLAKTNTGGPNLPKANVKGLFKQVGDLLKDIDSAPSTPMEFNSGKTVRQVMPTDGQRKGQKTREDYDRIREELAKQFTYTVGGDNQIENARKAVDDTLRGMREKNYGEKPYDFQGPAKPEAPAAAPKLLDTSTPDKQAEMDRWILAAPPAETAPRTLPAAAPAAAPAPAAGPERDMDALFLKATGTSFEPKSRVDVARKAQLEDLLKSKPELAGKSDTQVALEWYRQTENAKRK
jgi:hypothetical protein